MVHFGEVQNYASWGFYMDHVKYNHFRNYYVFIIMFFLRGDRCNSITLRSPPPTEFLRRAISDQTTHRSIDWIRCSVLRLRDPSRVQLLRKLQSNRLHGDLIGHQFQFTTNNNTRINGWYRRRRIWKRLTLFASKFPP